LLSRILILQIINVSGLVYLNLVICGGDCELLVQTGTKQRAQLVTVHCFQTPHRQLMRYDVVWQISSVLSQRLYCSCITDDGFFQLSTAH